MIVDLPSTTTSAVNKALVDLRESGGAVALGRVLTLVIVTEDADAEEPIAAANEASREHPCRVLVLVRGNKRGTTRLDAQLRVGGDAGASEVIVLRMYGPLADHGANVAIPLLLPDAPIVVWWPVAAPADPARDPVGRMAQRRITDAGAAANPAKALQQRRARHTPGDTDLAWTRVTQWRALLAAALDQPPYEAVEEVYVAGAADSPSVDLMAAWLAHTLDCPVTRSKTDPGSGMHSVRLVRDSGAVELVRAEGPVGRLSQPGQPDRQVALPRRPTHDCLTEELRRLDDDEVYGEALVQGLARLTRSKPAGVSGASGGDRASGGDGSAGGPSGGAAAGAEPGAGAAADAG